MWEDSLMNHTCLVRSSLIGKEKKKKTDSHSSNYVGIL